MVLEDMVEPTQRQNESICLSNEAARQTLWSSAGGQEYSSPLVPARSGHFCAVHIAVWAS
jgi:hypothetical protein